MLAKFSSQRYRLDCVRPQVWSRLISHSLYLLMYHKSPGRAGSGENNAGGGGGGLLINNIGPETSAKDAGAGYGGGGSGNAGGSPGVVILDLLGADSTPGTTSPGPSSTSNTPTPSRI